MSAAEPPQTGIEQHPPSPEPAPITSANSERPNSVTTRNTLSVVNSMEEHKASIQESGQNGEAHSSSGEKLSIAATVEMGPKSELPGIQDGESINNPQAALHPDPVNDPEVPPRNPSPRTSGGPPIPTKKFVGLHKSSVNALTNDWSRLTHSIVYGVC
ncbi:hypothetical protein MSAN_01214400 [Mycena sanguinolenta]|uniref:Uncharacterized protein n=1 Tax=Mycena sanguinolenta TaxID=230812 RepID=A0A8H6YGW6_9AGAR|nr:hypothetical protein MSAN_01214400 [Mycena sanguinolenta]